jgi:hypothetical protein
VFNRKYQGIVDVGTAARVVFEHHGFKCCAIDSVVNRDEWMDD